MTLQEFCKEFEGILKSGDQGWMDRGRDLVGRLAADSGWFGEVLERIILDPGASDQKPSIWPNEIAVYRCPEFTLLAYLWQERQADIIHDHGSWGIIGAMKGPILERKYDRLDDGGRESYAELKETVALTLQKGQTTSVLPLDEGIHRMENLGTGIGITTNAYGKGLKRGFIQFFDPESRSCWKAYPPSRLKQVLAIRVIQDVSGASGNGVLEKALKSASPVLKKEIESVLNKEK